jgi:hypothetical protein
MLGPPTVPQVARPRAIPERAPAATHLILATRICDQASARRRIDTDTAGEPLTLAVITATGYGYVRADGVAVIPIGALTA